MWIVVGIAVVAVVMIIIAGRTADEAGGSEGVVVDRIDDEGLWIKQSLVPWASVFEVTVVTRREFGGTWFGFEVQAEGVGVVIVEREGGIGERFLANSHRFVGFDHETLAAALQRRRGRSVCYRS